MPSLYFLDTSALLPGFLPRAPGHAWVKGICDTKAQNVITIAEVTAAELAASLNQLVRGGIVRKKRCTEALALFWDQVNSGAYNIIPVKSSIVRRAADLCEFHPLRGYDAVQLATALAFRDVARQAHATSAAQGGVGFGDPIFLTEDKRLESAATAEGFTVDTPLAHP